MISRSAAQELALVACWQPNGVHRQQATNADAIWYTHQSYARAVSRSSFEHQHHGQALYSVNMNCLAAVATPSCTPSFALYQSSSMCISLPSMCALSLDYLHRATKHRGVLQWKTMRDADLLTSAALGIAYQLCTTMANTVDLQTLKQCTFCSVCCPSTSMAAEQQHKATGIAISVARH